MASTACPKCGGVLFPEVEDYGKVWVCLQCGKRITNDELEEMMSVKGNGAIRGEEMPVPPKPDGLPPFPEFNADWPEAVQLRWLDTFSKLHGTLIEGSEDE